MSLKHAKVSAIADSGNTDLVQPTDWNAEHVLTGGLTKNLLMRDTGQANGLNFTDGMTYDNATDTLDVPNLTLDNALPVSQGGTGATSEANARTNLGLGTVATENIVPASKGGSGLNSSASTGTPKIVSGTWSVGDPRLLAYARASLPGGATAGDLARVSNSTGSVFMYGQRWYSLTGDVINIQDAPFNADPTGATVATTAFRTALQTLAELGGGTLLVPRGTYRLDGQIYRVQGVSLRGQGMYASVLDFEGNYSPIVTAVWDGASWDTDNNITTAPDNCSMSGVQIDARDMTADNTKFIVEIRGENWGYLEDCWLRGTGGGSSDMNGLYVGPVSDGTPGCYYITVSRNKITSTRYAIQHGHTSTDGGKCNAVWYQYNSIITMNRGFYLAYDGNLGARPNAVTFNYNSVEGSELTVDDYGVYLEGNGYAIDVSNNYFDHCNTGVRVQNTAQRAVVHNNVFGGTHTYKIDYQSTSTQTTGAQPQDNIFQMGLNLQPQKDVTRDLGGASNRWKNIYGNSSWDSGHLILGSYHLWIDSTGDLRIKSSAPTGETDGTVVGTQS